MSKKEFSLCGNFNDMADIGLLVLATMDNDAVTVGAKFNDMSPLMRTALLQAAAENESYNVFNALLYLGAGKIAQSAEKVFALGADWEAVEKECKSNDALSKSFADFKQGLAAIGKTDAIDNSAYKMANGFDKLIVSYKTPKSSK